MPETLTESFCERCGTRYTFEAAIPTGRRLGRLRVLTKGLAHFVMSDETSLDEAFADARSDQQREKTSHQLDAFHQTFQFCMSCRQYTCANCWNGPEGRCLSCAPHLGQETLDAPFPDLDPTAGLAPVDASTGAASGNGQALHPSIDASAWPTADLPVTRTFEAGGVAAEAPAAGAEAVAAEAVAEAPPVSAAPVAEAEEIDEDVTRAVADAERSRAAAPVAAEVGTALAESSGTPRALENPPGRAVVAPGRKADLFARFRPGRRAPVRTAEPASATSIERSPESTPEEPAAVEPAAVEPAAVEPAAWRIVAPEVTEPPAPGPDLLSVPPTVLTAQPASPVLPIQAISAVESARQPAPTSSRPTHTETPPTQWMVPSAKVAPQWPARPAVPPPVPPAADLWAASSQDVLNRPGSGVQACVSCGLPLSATARFCRRCGSQQH
jgi:hypothetical protein